MRGLISVFVSGAVEAAGTWAGAVLALSAVVGLVVRYVLLPYLRDQLVKPVQETHRQVTPHDAENPTQTPTVRDQLDELTLSVDELKETAGELGKKAQVNRRLAEAAGRTADAVGRRLADHEAWAREEDSRVWSAIRQHERLPGHNELVSRIDRLLNEREEHDGEPEPDAG